MTAVVHGGFVKGKITYIGFAPIPKSFELNKFPQSEYCGKEDNDGKGHRLLHDVNVGKDGSLEDVVVAIEHVEKGKPFNFSGTDTNADICRFLVQGAPSKFVGVAVKKAEFRVRNLDADPADPKTSTGVLHNPHLFEETGSSSSTIFNLPLPNKDQVINKPTIIRKKESILHLQCDQHSYMNSYYYPVENPYYAIVGADGTFSIDGIPPGEYEIHAWHPVLGQQEARISVSAGGKIIQNFAFGGILNQNVPGSSDGESPKKHFPKIETRSEATTINLNTFMPDLEVTSTIPNESAIDAGSRLSIVDEVTNHGTAINERFSIAYHLSASMSDHPSDYIDLPSFLAIDSLGQDTSDTSTTLLEIPPNTPGNSYFLCSEADPENRINESDEENNIFCSYSKIVVRRPDLIVNTITSSVIRGSAGSSIPINLTLLNEGNGAAGPSVVSFYLSTSGIFANLNNVVSRTQNELGHLHSGERKKIALLMQIPENMPEGNYHICAIADAHNSVAESNEENNWACTSNTVTIPLPDLVVTSLSTKVSKVRSGEDFAIEAMIYNRGGSTASASEIEFLLTKNKAIGDKDDIPLFPKMQLDKLDVGTGKRGKVIVTLPAGTPAGPYYIMAWVN
ncbi:MAG: hypothetical protein HYR80_07285 [Nitrospirae bacterium]|nr:hypothetical protein [Nitrospirota bacterium]